MDFQVHFCARNLEGKPGFGGCPFTSLL